MSKLDNLRKEMKALKSKMKKEGKVALKETFVEYFDKHPIVECIVWTQYTPYFNDGEACMFGVNEFEVHFKKENSSNLQVTFEVDDYGYGEYYDSDNFTDEQSAADVDLGVLQNSCMDVDDILHDLFGDHCKVVATRKGFKVTEFEHD